MSPKKQNTNTQKNNKSEETIAVCTYPAWCRCCDNSKNICTDSRLRCSFRKLVIKRKK